MPSYCCGHIEPISGPFSGPLCVRTVSHARQKGRSWALFALVLGPTVAVGKRVDTAGCVVKVEKISVGKAREIKMKNGRSLISKTISQMAEDVHRNKRIARLILRLFEEGRCIIVTTDRTVHLQLLKDAIMEEGIGEEDIGIFKGETSKKRVRQRDIEKTRRILLATYGMAAEGFDKPSLDTLVMATPKSSIEQVVGRILRSHPDKKKAKVIDLYDTYCGGAIIGMHKARIRFYKDNEYTIQN